VANNNKYGIADTKRIVPGLYRMYDTTTEGVYKLMAMDSDDIAAGNYTVGQVTTLKGTGAQNYVVVSDLFNTVRSADDVENTYNLNWADLAVYAEDSTVVLPAGASAASDVANDGTYVDYRDENVDHDSDPRYVITDTSALYTLSYDKSISSAAVNTAKKNAELYKSAIGTLTASDMDTVLAEGLNASKLAADVNNREFSKAVTVNGTTTTTYYNHNDVVIKYDAKGNIVWAVSFLNDANGGNYAQYVWNNLLPYASVLTDSAAPTIVGPDGYVLANGSTSWTDNGNNTYKASVNVPYANWNGNSWNNSNIRVIPASGNVIMVNNAYNYTSSPVNVTSTAGTSQTISVSTRGTKGTSDGDVKVYTLTVNYVLATGDASLTYAGNNQTIDLIDEIAGVPNNTYAFGLNTTELGKYSGQSLMQMFRPTSGAATSEWTFHTRGAAANDVLTVKLDANGTDDNVVSADNVKTIQAAETASVNTYDSITVTITADDGTTRTYNWSTDVAKVTVKLDDNTLVNEKVVLKGSKYSLDASLTGDSGALKNLTAANKAKTWTISDASTTIQFWSVALKHDNLNPTSAIVEDNNYVTKADAEVALKAAGVTYQLADGNQSTMKINSKDSEIDMRKVRLIVGADNYDQSIYVVKGATFEVPETYRNAVMKSTTFSSYNASTGVTNAIDNDVSVTLYKLVFKPTKTWNDSNEAGTIAFGSAASEGFGATATVYADSALKNGDTFSLTVQLPSSIDTTSEYSGKSVQTTVDGGVTDVLALSCDSTTGVAQSAKVTVKVAVGSTTILQDYANVSVTLTTD
jgi:hypothetical protein